MKLLSGECHKTTLIISQHWFRQSFGVIRQHTSPQPMLTQIYALLGYNVLTSRTRQNGWHFRGDLFKCISLNEKVWISNIIWLQFVPKAGNGLAPDRRQAVTWTKDNPVQCGTREDELTSWTLMILLIANNNDVVKWKHFPRYWPFVRGIHRSRWIPDTKASDAELWCFLWSAPE